MRCQCVKEYGKPLFTDMWQTPQPQGEEVLVKITASGLCHSDVHIADGGFDMGDGQTLKLPQAALPRVPGHEIVGTVAQTGPDCPPLDRSKTYIVFPWIGCGTCDTCADEGENHCTKAPRALGVDLPGGYSEYVLVPHSRYLIDIGDLDPALAAPLACSGLTTYSALEQIGAAIYQKHPVVVMGAGGLGLMSLQILAALGGKGAVAVDIDAGKRQAALAAGALAAIDPKAPDALAQIAQATGGGARAVLDLVGAESTVGLTMQILRKPGRAIIVGLFGGSVKMPTFMLPSKAMSLIGSYVGDLAQLQKLVALARAGKVKPMPVTRIGFDDIPGALEALRQGKVIGRQVAVLH